MNGENKHLTLEGREELMTLPLVKYSIPMPRRYYAKQIIRVLASRQRTRTHHSPVSVTVLCHFSARFNEHQHQSTPMHQS